MNYIAAAAVSCHAPEGCPDFPPGRPSDKYCRHGARVESVAIGREEYIGKSEKLNPDFSGKKNLPVWEVRFGYMGIVS